MNLTLKLNTLIQAYSISPHGLTNALSCFEPIGGLTAYNRLVPCFYAFVKHNGARKLMLAICAKHFSRSENYEEARKFLKSTAERFFALDSVKNVLHRRINGGHIKLWQPKQPEYARSPIYDDVHYVTKNKRTKWSA